MMFQNIRQTSPIHQLHDHPEELFILLVGAHELYDVGVGGPLH
jgi:hypothetical protein